MSHVVKVTLLLLISMFTLSGCLVEKKDQVKIARTQDTLRIYESGDFITYSVDEIRYINGSTAAPVIRTGTLSIQWADHAPLLSPVPTTTPSITVLEETISLTFGDNNPEAITVRYVSQDITTGELTLHAIKAPESNKYYWLSTGDKSVNPTIPIESFSIFASPIIVGTVPSPSVTFDVIEGCDADSDICTDHFGWYTDTMDIVDDQISITTNLGVFTNPFQISFSGNTFPYNGFPIIDLRNACGTNAPATHNGTMYVMPEIGIVQMTNSCVISAGDTIQHIIRLRSTSFDPFP